MKTARFFKASSEQAGLWGADVTGVADGALRKLRVLAGGATTTRVAGRSLELDLALSDTSRLDPAYEAHRLHFPLGGSDLGGDCSADSP